MWAIGVGGLALLATLVWTGRERRRRGEAERRLGEATMELERLQLSFARFAPRTVIDDVIRRGLSTTAEEKEVTVLFADLRGFTAMSEGMSPTTLVEILNGYFDRMSEAITQHGGHVSKFIGDGIMAVFGAVDHNPWHASDAARAALAMRAALDRYNEELEQSGMPRLAIGIGLHLGPVVAGVVGCDQLMEFTVIGETVNLASRVESLTRRHDTTILVTQAVRSALDPKFELVEQAPATVKGVSDPVATWALVRDAAEDR